MDAVDLACATPAYLDLTFVGLPELPGPGQERFARDLLRSPGGGAITALGAARLGLTVALASPLGSDGAGRLLRDALAAEGVLAPAPPVEQTPTTVVVPHADDRAMITHDPGTRADPALLAELAPRAVVAGLSELIALTPDGARAYATVDDRDATEHAGTLPAALGRADAVLLNADEGRRLTGREPLEAARALAEPGAAVVITLGAAGALAVVDGAELRTPGIPVPVVDTTGAGDLFVATWVWGDLTGLDPEARLRWATLAAALSVGVVTGAAGAVRLEVLLEEGARRGLPAPPGAAPVPGPSGA